MDVGMLSGQVLEMTNNPHYLHRMTILRAISLLASVVGSEITNSKLLPVVINASKDRYLVFLELCLPNGKNVLKEIEKKKIQEICNLVGLMSAGLNFTLQGTQHKVQCGKGAPIPHPYCRSLGKYLMRFCFLICIFSFFFTCFYRILMNYYSLCCVILFI
jgi:hypothetical protein